MKKTGQTLSGAVLLPNPPGGPRGVFGNGVPGRESVADCAFRSCRRPNKANGMPLHNCLKNTECYNFIIFPETVKNGAISIFSYKFIRIFVHYFTNGPTQAWFSERQAGAAIASSIAAEVA